MPTPLRESRLEALNVAIARDEAVFSVWSRFSAARQMYFVGASVCFEGELYDLTDVGWVLRDEKERAFCLSPNRPEIEGDQPPSEEGLTDAQGRAPDEADQREQTFVEELGNVIGGEPIPYKDLPAATETPPETFAEQVVNDNPVLVAEVERIAEETAAAFTPEEQPIVRTPGRARTKVEA